MEVMDRILRTRLRAALSGRPLKRLDATLYRDGTAIGTVGGYYYEKASQYGAFTISLPGQLADQPEGHYMMALYPDELPDAQEGDELAIGGDRYQVLAVRGCGAYDTYSLGVMA